MTTTNIAAPITPVDDSKPKPEAALASLLEQLHERQDRVAGELGEWRKLGKTPEEAAAERDRLKQRLADLEAESRDFKALGRRCEEAEQHLREVEQQRDAAQAKLDACYDGTALLDVTIEREELKQELADANDRNEQADSIFLSLRAVLDVPVVDGVSIIDHAARVVQQLAEANARAESMLKNYETAVAFAAERDKAWAEVDSWKARALRYEQVTAEVLDKLRMLLSQQTCMSDRAWFEYAHEQITALVTTPQDREPEGERREGHFGDREVHAGDVVEWIDSLGERYVADVLAANEREGALIKPRGHAFVIQAWVSQSRVRVVPNPSKPSPTPAAEQQEGGGSACHPHDMEVVGTTHAACKRCGKQARLRHG
jgi:hypothetical protein